jgi:hypothetical protein
LSDPGILRAILVKAGFDLGEQIALFDRVLDGDQSALDDVHQRIPGLNRSLTPLLTIEGRGPEFLSNLRGSLGDAIPELTDRRFVQPFATARSRLRVLYRDSLPRRGRWTARWRRRSLRWIDVRHRRRRSPGSRIRPGDGCYCIASA